MKSVVEYGAFDCPYFWVESKSVKIVLALRYRRRAALLRFATRSCRSCRICIGHRGSLSAIGLLVRSYFHSSDASAEIALSSLTTTAASSSRYFSYDGSSCRTIDVMTRFSLMCTSTPVISTLKNSRIDLCTVLSLSYLLFPATSLALNLSNASKSRSF
jgi:hypothetical protein